MTLCNSSSCSLQNIRMSYGRKRILSGLDLQLEMGGILGLVGNNGSGKTTLLKILAGILKPEQGTLLLSPKLLPGIGYMPEACLFYSQLSALQNLEHFRKLKGIASKSESERCLKRVGLWDSRRKKVRAYSKGMKQRLTFAQALLGDPGILILDEPTNGLDPDGIAEFYKILGELRRSERVIILSSHLLAEIESHITHIACLNRGKIGLQDSCSKLLDDGGRLRMKIRLLPRSAAGFKTEVERLSEQTKRRGVSFCILENEIILDCLPEKVSELMRFMADLGAWVQDLDRIRPDLRTKIMNFLEKDV